VQLYEKCGAEFYPARLQKLPAQMLVSLYIALDKDKIKECQEKLQIKEEVRQYVVLETETATCDNQRGLNNS
jgi:hypothetical protein